MNVSKSTIVEAYDRLVAEGIIQSRRGAGFYVSERARQPFSLATNTQHKERQIDPDSGALISEQKSKEKSSSASGFAGGAPGTASNLPGAAGPNGGSGSDTSESSTTTNNFDYSVVEKTVEEPIGTVKKLSVAVTGSPQPRGPITVLFFDGAGVDRSDVLSDCESSGRHALRCKH